MVQEDKNKAVQRVKKLLELADTKKNSNIEEAAAAAAKAQSLIEKYRIEKSLLNSGDGQIQWKQLEDKGQPEIWKNFLTGTLARHNGCFVVKSENYETDGQIYVVGEPQDTDIIQKIYTYLVYELNKLCIKELLTYKTRYGFYPNKNYSKSFYLGAITKIDEKLEIARKTARDSELKRASNKEDKEKVKVALSKLDNKADKAKEWVKSNLNNARIEDVSPEKPDPKAFIAGNRAAEDISLNTSPELKGKSHDK